MYLIQFDENGEFIGQLRNPYEAYSKEEIDVLLENENNIIVDELPKEPEYKEGFTYKLILETIKGKKVLKYVEEIVSKSDVEILEEKVNDKLIYLKNKIDLNSDIFLENSYEISRDELKLAYENNSIDKELVLFKIKNNSIYLEDYKFITGEDLDYDEVLTLEQAIDNKKRELKNKYYDRIINGIITKVNDVEYLFRYDLKDQQNYIEKAYFINRAKVKDKGEIGLSTEFPSLDSVDLGDRYHITHLVIDNDTTKTYTNQRFDPNDVIVWNGRKWIGEEYFNNVIWTGYSIEKGKIKLDKNVKMSNKQFEFLHSELSSNKEELIEECNTILAKVEGLKSIDEVLKIKYTKLDVLDEYYEIKEGALGE